MCPENKILKSKTKPEYARSSKWSAKHAFLFDCLMLGSLQKQVGAEQGLAPAAGLGQKVILTRESRAPRSPLGCCGTKFWIIPWAAFSEVQPDLWHIVNLRIPSGVVLIQCHELTSDQRVVSRGCDTFLTAFRYCVSQKRNQERWNKKFLKHYRTEF